MPQLSVGSFAMFMKASPAKQRTILRDSKFPRLKDGQKKPQIVRYSETRAAIRHYHESGNDVGTLLKAVEGLTKKKIEHPEKNASRIDDNIRAINTYMKYFSKNQFTILDAPRPKYEHNGVLISTAPDLYVEENGERKLIKLDFNQKKPDPEVVEILLKVMHEAAAAGFYKSPHVEGKFPRIQILTIAQLLMGQQIAYPRLLDVTYKKAPRARGKAAETIALPLTEGED